MDLNLYLGIFDLALSSLPLPSTPSTAQGMTTPPPPPPDDLDERSRALQVVRVEEAGSGWLLSQQEGLEAPIEGPPSPARDNAHVSPYSSAVLPVSTPQVLNPPGRGSDAVSSQQEGLQRSVEACFRRLMESDPPPARLRRFILHTGSRCREVHFLRATEQLMRDSDIIMSSQRVIVATRKHGVLAEGVTAEGTEENSRGAADFECNICLELSKDPVVTSCGHLFCWPCLYQWLHLHSDHSECPACKGHVDESKITPIYGRGGMEATAKESFGDDSELGVEIPPRPHGHRTDSSGQMLQRPISRRLGGDSLRSLTRILGGDSLGSLTRIVEDDNARLQSLINGALIDGARHTVISMLREWRTQREGGNNESWMHTEGMELPRNNTSDPQIDTTISLRDEVDQWHGSPLSSYVSSHNYDALSTDPSRMEGRFDSGSSQAGASASSVNNRDHQPLLPRPPSETALTSEQASASSSMALIDGHSAVNDAAGEPYAAAAGSSWPRRRRRGTSDTSGSFVVDGGEFHALTRRRPN